VVGAFSLDGCNKISKDFVDVMLYARTYTCVVAIFRSICAT